MNRFIPLLSAAFLLSGASAQAQGPDPAAASVQHFYDGLTASMKSGGTTKSRYEKLKPVVEQDFDLPGMTALAVGPSWSSIPAADQKTLTDAFGRMTIANYARNFDSFHGEKFTVDPAVSQRGTDKYVKSTLATGGAPIAFNYRMHQAGSSWKVLDVYLAGNISQLAQKRADFAAALTAGGPQGLAKQINAIADKELGS